MGKLLKMWAKVGFQPTSLPNLAVWVDATDFGTLTLSSDRVSQWRDKSGLGNHLVQASGSLQPLYVASALGGRPAVQTRDDGTARLVSVASNASLSYSTCSCFAVFQRVTDTGSNETFVGKWNAAGNLRQFRMLLGSTDLVTTQGSADGSAITTVNTGSAVATGTPYIIDGSYTGTQLTISRNNSTPGATNLASMFSGAAPFSVGAAGNAAEPAASYIGEVLFYTAVLSSAQRLQVLNYLSGKWNIAIS